MVRIDSMEKQLDRIAEIKDLEGFFDRKSVQVTADGENCYLVTFQKESDVTYSNMGYWECNGFKLVGFGVNDNKELTATFNVNERRIMQGTVKEVLVIQ